MFEQDNILPSTQPIVIITYPSVQSHSFARYLSEKLPVSVRIQNITKPLDQRLPAGVVILFDIAVSNKKLNNIWCDILNSQTENCRFLILNGAQPHELFERAQWPALHGVFRHDDEQTKIVAGIEAVLRGEAAEISGAQPDIASDTHRVVGSGNDIPLTERECEILNELRCGASNMDIARALFISENTVRTHLYNVFRKLSVKNRTQAVSWANEFLRHQSQYNADHFYS